MLLFQSIKQKENLLKFGYGHFPNLEWTVFCEYPPLVFRFFAKSYEIS